MRPVRPIRTRLAGVLTTLALAGALTACGSEDPQAADSSSPAADTSSPTTATSPSATDEPQSLDDGGEIAVDDFVAKLQAGIDKTKYAHIEFSMSGAGGELRGSGDSDYTAQPPNTRMTMQIGPRTLGMLLVDKVIYLQSSKGGHRYVAYDLGDPSNPLGSGLSSQLDPATSIQGFVDAVKSVTYVGKEDVDGQTLDRYSLVIDTTKLADQAQSAGLPAEMETGVWLDQEGRPAKMSMAMGPVDYEATLSDFDKPVHLQAPPADQVVKPGS
jgi:hypothetical protein